MTRFDPGIYMDTYADLRRAYSDMRKRGQLQAGTGSYYDAYGKNLSEKNWVDILNKSTGKNKSDVRGFTADEFAKAHYDRFGKREKRIKKDAYKTAYQAAPEQVANQDDYFNIDRFNNLLNELEASKGRQVRQKAVEGRRDIFATGLSSMMSNF